MEIECTTTEEAERAIAAGDTPVLIGDVRISVSVSCWIVCKAGKPHVVARESSQPHVVARGSSQPHVEAWGSSQPHVEAWESSQPHVEAWGSSQPHVEARESSQPHVVAWESSQPHVVARESSQPHVVAWESSQPHVEAKATCQVSVRGAVKLVAAATVAICVLGGTPDIAGGGFIAHVDVSTPRLWCDHYGAEIDGEDAILFKALDKDFCAQRNRFAYVPGTTPEAPDWDGGKQECGRGLHFSPSPLHALRFVPNAKRFVACRVPLNSIAVHPDGEYPEKCKAPRVTEIWEVDRYGKRIEV